MGAALVGAYVMLAGHLDCAPRLLTAAATSTVAVAAIGGFGMLGGTLACAALTAVALRQYPTVCAAIGAEAVPM